MFSVLERFWAKGFLGLGVWGQGFTALGVWLHCTFEGLEIQGCI